MTDQPSALTPERFAQGFTYERYLEQVETNREQFDNNFTTMTLEVADRQYFTALGSRLPRLNVLVIGEDWCPDVYTNLPILMRVAEAAANMEIRIFPRDRNLDLMSQYLNNGFMSIPVFVFFDPDWREIGRFVERPVRATHFMNETRAQLAASGLPQEEQMKEFRRRLREVRDGFRQETVREIREILAKLA